MGEQTLEDKLDPQDVATVDAQKVLEDIQSFPTSDLSNNVNYKLRTALSSYQAAERENGKFKFANENQKKALADQLYDILVSSVLADSDQAAELEALAKKDKAGHELYLRDLLGITKEQLYSSIVSPVGALDAQSEAQILGQITQQLIGAYNNKITSTQIKTRGDAVRVLDTVRDIQDQTEALDGSYIRKFEELPGGLNEAQGYIQSTAAGISADTRNLYMQKKAANDANFRLSA